jgi:hypothetical protein
LHLCSKNSDAEAATDYKLAVISIGPPVRRSRQCEEHRPNLIELIAPM